MIPIKPAQVRCGEIIILERENLEGQTFKIVFRCILYIGHEGDHYA